jgi:chemotaxis protein methyltransferase CheR
MIQAVSETSLIKLSRFVTDRMGLWYPRERFGDLERSLVQAAGELDFADAEGFVDWLLSSSLSRKEIEKLSSHFTIGETYFFRDGNVFRALETEVIPGLIQEARGGHRNLRLWSAACSSGEEPYSIAILLHKLIPDLADWNITILATDINPVFIQKAETGVYGEWSFRDTPKWIKEQYFTREQGSRYRIVPAVKKMVTFSHVNLAVDTYPTLFNNTNAMNIIFCRNVLMYFEPGRARSVIGKLHCSLVDGGWLFVSPCEVSQDVFTPFLPVSFDGAIAYRKGGDRVLTSEHPGRPDPVFVPDASPVCNSANSLGDQSAVAPVFTFPPPEPDSPSPSQAGKPDTAIPETDAYTRALHFYVQGRYQEAAGILMAHVSENCTLRDMTLLARSLSNQGKLDEAMFWCEQAAARDKLNPDLHYLLAVILLELGRMDSAVMSLKRTLYLDPGFVLAHFALANIHRNDGRIKESEKNVRNVLELLNGMAPDLELPGSDGLTAGRLKGIVTSMYRENGDG